MTQTLHPIAPTTVPNSIWARIGPWLGVLVSSLLLALYAQQASFWWLGFVVFVPWILALNQAQSLRRHLALGLAMSIGYVFAALYWFAPAFGQYVGLGQIPAYLILLGLSPILQPQIMVFALVSTLARRHLSWSTTLLLSALAWVAAEWALPKLLGDQFGHGLQPSSWLRQAADLAGASGLTFMLLLVNAWLALSLQGWRRARTQSLRFLMLAIALTAAWAGYGYWRLQSVRAMQAEPSMSVRVGMVQANITQLEKMRAERGAYAVIRHLLDTHYAMSAHAVQQQGAEALLWSETIYPTTFGNPKSDDGATLDQEILQFVRDLNVPLVMGTYDRDEAGEYNSAAFLEPERGLLGHYRKAHPFPLTEYVPPWLDGPRFRQWLPWTGSWQPGSGARALPLRTADGREVNVVPLICLDDVHPQLAIDGARLGAQALVGLSNDSWFTDYPSGARLHLAVATFRSIETRLPQLRVTTNGYSALVDETGDVVARTDMNQQAVFVGEVPIRDPAPTLMVRWGDWFGRFALLVLALCAALLGLKRAQTWLDARARPAPVFDPDTWSAPVWLLTRHWRWLLILLHACAISGLIWLAARMIWIDGLQVNSLTQIYGFVALVALPLMLSWWLQSWHRYQASVQAGLLLLVRAGTRIEIDVQRIEHLQVLPLSLPWPTLRLQFDQGQSFAGLIAVDDPVAFSAALTAQGGNHRWLDAASTARAKQAEQRSMVRHRWLDATWLQYGVWPLLMSLPAFRLHQHITFGGTFGEWQTFGPTAWLVGLLIWWVAWAIGLALLGTLLRGATRFVEWVWARWQPDMAWQRRRQLEWLRRLLYYAGVPLWLAIRILGA